MILQSRTSLGNDVYIGLGGKEGFLYIVRDFFDFVFQFFRGAIGVGGNTLFTQLFDMKRALFRLQPPHFVDLCAFDWRDFSSGLGFLLFLCDAVALQSFAGEVPNLGSFGLICPLFGNGRLNISLIHSAPLFRDDWLHIVLVNFASSVWIVRFGRPHNRLVGFHHW